MSKVSRDQGGFTLIELVVVVAILAIIAFLVTPRVLDALDKSKKNSAISVMNEVAGALERYAAKLGETAVAEYPSLTTTSGAAGYDELRTALAADATLPESATSGRYFDLTTFAYDNPTTTGGDYAVEVTATDRAGTVICARPSGVTLAACP